MQKSGIALCKARQDRRKLCAGLVVLPSEYNQLCPVSMVIWKMFYFKHLLQSHTISKATPLDRTQDTAQIKHVYLPCQAYKRGSAQEKHSSHVFFFFGGGVTFPLSSNDEF